jgi:hypothetical protein
MAAGMSAVLVLFKIAPALCDLQPPVSLECMCNKELNDEERLAEAKAGNISDSDLEEDVKRIKCSPYKMFKNFLLAKRCVDIDGCSSYVHTVKTLAQVMNAGDAITTSPSILPKNACHTAGSTVTQVKKRGIYEVIFDSELAQPAQFAVFNKDRVNETAIAGSNGGASEIAMEQLLCLDRDDSLSVRNHISYINPVATQLNAGGFDPAENSAFTLLRIAPAPSPKSKCCTPKGKR